jgi:hypothetical protein
LGTEQTAQDEGVAQWSLCCLVHIQLATSKLVLRSTSNLGMAEVEQGLDQSMAVFGDNLY